MILILPPTAEGTRPAIAPAMACFVHAFSPMVYTLQIYDIRDSVTEIRVQLQYTYTLQSTQHGRDADTTHETPV